MTNIDSGICYWESLIRYTSFNSGSRIIERESKNLLVWFFGGFCALSMGPRDWIPLINIHWVNEHVNSCNLWEDASLHQDQVTGDYFQSYLLLLLCLPLCFPYPTYFMFLLLSPLYFMNFYTEKIFFFKLKIYTF